MAKKVISIAIGAECTKVCEISFKKNNKNKGIRIYRSITFETPENLVDDGYIRDMTAFGELLKNRLKEAKIKSGKVIFTINSGKIATREVIIPPIRENRIMDIIKTGASEYFPVNIKDYVISYQILEKDIGASKSEAVLKKHKKKERRLAKERRRQERKALKKGSSTKKIPDNPEIPDIDAVPYNNGNGSKVAGHPLTGKQMRLMVYAAPAALINNYYSFARTMHLDIISLDYSGNSSYQIIKRQQKHGTNVFVQMNERDTLISILREDVLVMQRTVSYGLALLLEAVMEQDCFRLIDAEAALNLLKEDNLLSQEHSLSPLAGQEAAAAIDEPSQTKSIAARNIRDSLRSLCSSIVRMLDYYKSSHKQIDIDTIYITGCGVHIKGIEEFFTAEVGIPHKVMDKLATVSASRKAIHFRKSPSEYLYNLGAVIKPADFVPLEFTLRKQRRSAIFGIIILSLVCLIGSAGIVYLSFTDYLEAKKELDALTAQLESMPGLSGVHDEYDKHIKEIEELENLVETTAGHNEEIKNILAEFEKKLPSNTVINTMKFEESGVYASMRITSTDGKAGANALIAKTLKQLKSIHYFGGNVTVEDSVISDEDGISAVTLSVRCIYVQQKP
jgi:type IV pilus assembly protein PilN